MKFATRVESRWWTATRPAIGLRALARIYGAVSTLHLRWRSSRSVEVGVPVISVGNITVGGSGKTPFVAWLAAALREHGRHPVVLCRGDGGRAAGVCDVGPASDPYVVGDEAVLLARLCNCPVIAAKDRIAGARRAATLGDVIVLDDGFQYRQLRRDCDIVLVPAEGVGNGFLLPAGPLREPLERLSRADLVIRVGKQEPVPLGGIKSGWRWWSEPGPIEDSRTQCKECPRDVLALAGIARPERFFADLESLGLKIRQRCVFPDHHRYRKVEVRRLLAFGMPVVTTLKDAVKLQRLWPSERPLWVMHQRPCSQAGLLAHICEHLD